LNHPWQLATVETTKIFCAFVLFQLKLDVKIFF